MRSVSTPIVLASVAVSLAISMLVGWTLVIVHSFSMESYLPGGVWLLVTGIASIVFIVTVLVLFGISLVKEILESRRQISFIDSVTHELKSPLASLNLCVQTLARPNLTEEQRADLLGMMESDVGRLSAFIDDVLNASRVTSTRQASSITEFKLEDLLSQVMERVHSRHSAKAGRIDLKVEGELLLATDRAAVELAVGNLIDNAVKYSDDPPEVRVRAWRRSNGKLEIEVRDRGIGMERRDLQRVFERFFRAPDEAVRSRRGTGLGLYVASAMIRGLGGRVLAESAGPGEGTTMRMVLPASLVIESSRHPIEDANEDQTMPASELAGDPKKTMTTREGDS